MKQKHLFLFSLGVLVSYVAALQNNDELQIPLESDNQFPPENHSDPSEVTIEGSGNGFVEEPSDTTTEFAIKPKIEDIKPSVLLEDEISSTSDSDVCPKPCVCNIEGDSNNFIVDCSGYGLSELPSIIDPKTTTLNLQNNKLTKIPKEISALKNLKVLNANNNEIMEIAPGSISELPDLVTLKLAKNRLIEYPKDLKNSLVLTKLEELDLGGNDMRTNLASDVFLQFKSLKKLTLATSTPELLDELCAAFKETLETVCTESCETQTHDCPDTPQNIEEDLIDATLPGMIAFNMGMEDSDPAPDVSNDNKKVTTAKSQEISEPSNTSESSNAMETSSVTAEKTQPVSEFSLRTAVNKEPGGEVKFNSIIVDSKKEPETPSSETDVKIGAKTSESRNGGVDKSVIAIIVAGMVVVVAVITIKKNWSSIKKRFGSSSRPPNDRTEVTANGTSPEEVPLQDKSPV